MIFILSDTCCKLTHDKDLSLHFNWSDENMMIDAETIHGYYITRTNEKVLVQLDDYKITKGKNICYS